MLNKQILNTIVIVFCSKWMFSLNMNLLVEHDMAAICWLIILVLISQNDVPLCYLKSAIRIVLLCMPQENRINLKLQKLEKAKYFVAR